MKKYNIIYADPPWRYQDKNCSGAASHHYDTMSIDELCELPIDKLADKDCVLFLWTTYPMLEEALRLIRSWGFKYKTIGFVWVKLNRSGKGYFFGLGRWTRGNSEICLIAKRGKISRQSAGVSQLIFSPIEAHSKKPDIVRDKIVELMGDIPRVELFARQKAQGWDCWGNEVESNVDFITL